MPRCNYICSTHTADGSEAGLLQDTFNIVFMHEVIVKI